MEGVQRALAGIQDIARRLVIGREDPLLGAYAIYHLAANAGAFEISGPDHERLRGYGSEFFQLAEVLEEVQGKPEVRRRLEELILAAARSVLAGEETPSWWRDAEGNIHRGDPSWARGQA